MTLPSTARRHTRPQRHQGRSAASRASAHRSQSAAPATDSAADLRDAILSMVGHELRTPLLHIKGFASSLLQTDIRWDDETRLDFLRSIDREADRLTKLVDDLSAISSMEAGRLPLDLTDASPQTLAWTGVDEASPFIHRHRINVTIPPDLPLVCVDQSRVVTVLVNLLANAARYSDPGSVIEIGARLSGRSVIFTVTDCGVGIPGKYHSAVFDLFMRVPETSRDRPGTGLGLAICKAAVESHGGEIWVESEEGRGSSFHFSLPVAIAEEVIGP